LLWFVPAPRCGTRHSQPIGGIACQPGLTSPDRCTSVIDTDLRTVRRLRDAPNPFVPASFEFRGPKRGGPGGQLPTGASRGFTGGLLHEHAHPERAGL